MSDAFPVVRGAAVQASSVLLDRAATTSKVCDLIAEAGRNGADFVVFPEGFLPGHPSWFHFLPATDPVAADLNVELYLNAVEVPGPEVDAIARAAGDAGAHVVLGVCERSPYSPGSLFNSQLYFGADGTYLGKHQKLMPTVGERLVHQAGWGDTLGTFATSFGPASALVCGENSNPLAVFALTAEGSRVHAMSWPDRFFRRGDRMPDIALTTARAFAQVSKAFVVSSCGITAPDFAERVGATGADAEFLRSGVGEGGSAIIAPDTTVLAGPLEGGREGIVYAEMDLALWVRQKMHQDYAGHYNRGDVFSFSVNRTPSVFGAAEPPGPAGVTVDGTAARRSAADGAHRDEDVVERAAGPIPQPLS